MDGAGRLFSRRSAVRGAVQFTLATFGRIQRHRMSLAIGFGLSLTIAMPIVLAWWSPAEGARRRDLVIPLLAAGPTLMFFVAAGVRVALALPSEAAASWIFSTVPSPVWAGRLAARRVMWAFAVVPGAAVAAAAAIAVWEIWPAVLTGAVVALTGAILTDLHLWGFAAVPCARLAAPGSANLQGRWPIYLAGLYLVCVLLPQSLAAARDAGALGWFALGLLPLATIVRVASDRAARVNAIVDDDERQLLLLDLSVQPGERRVPHA